MQLLVQVPSGLIPGELFNVEAASAVFEIAVPDGVHGGELIEVDLPVEHVDDSPPHGPDDPLVVEIAVPEDTAGGSEILIEHEGLQFYVVVPEGLGAGDIFAVEVPQQTGQEAEDLIKESPPTSPATEQAYTKPASPTRRRRKKSSGFESWLSFPLATSGAFDIRQGVEVYRTDGTWSAATVEAYDDSSDTYDVVLEDGRVKYLVESDHLRHIKVCGGSTAGARRERGGSAAGEHS